MLMSVTKRTIRRMLGVELMIVKVAVRSMVPVGVPLTLYEMTPTTSCEMVMMPEAVIVVGVGVGMGVGVEVMLRHMNVACASLAC